MKPLVCLLLSILLLLSTAPTLPAQQNGAGQPSQLLLVSPPGDKFLRWHGFSGRTYFIQISDPSNHLAKWHWAPIIETGNDQEISYEVGDTAGKGFYRLKYTDQWTNDPDGDDFDEDGLSNWEEVGIHNTDPLNRDTDGDGLPDGWETVHGLDPNTPADAGQPFGSGGWNLTNLEAWQAGVMAYSGATPNDRDGDGCPDSIDDHPADPALFQPWVSGIEAWIVGHGQQPDENESPFHSLLTVAWDGSPSYDYPVQGLLLPQSLTDGIAALTPPQNPPKNAPCRRLSGISDFSSRSDFYQIENDSYFREGSLAVSRLWLHAPSAAYVRKFHFLKVTSTKIGEGARQESAEPFAITVPANQTVSEPVDVETAVFSGEDNVGHWSHVCLIPLEFELTHVEKERDQDGNELSTVVNPGKDVLLRDEIADLRIKVPTVNNVDWDMKIDLEPADMKTETLGTRGNVQMYDFGTVDNGSVTPLTANANGTTRAGPYDLKIKHSNGGQETIKVVVNKEGKFKIRLKSADNKIDVTSREFSVKKRIRKYARRPENNNADFDRHDNAFIDAAESWGDFYQRPLDPDILKAMGMQESTLGFGANPTVDILTINFGGNDQDHVLAILHKEHTTNEKEAVPEGGGNWMIRWLDYDDANANSARTAIHWGTCWLFHKAQKGKFVNSPNSPPHYVSFAGWNSWETAVGYYGPNPVYLGVVEGPWKRGRRDSTTGKVSGVWKKIDFAENDFQYLWPVLTNQRTRK